MRFEEKLPWLGRNCAYFIKLISVLIVLSVLMSGCEEDYKRGYESGLRNGKRKGYEQGYEEGMRYRGKERYKEGYDKGYSDAMERVTGEKVTFLKTIDEAILGSRGYIAVFWGFSALCVIALLIGWVFLLVYQDEGEVIVANLIVTAASVFLWFMVIQKLLFVHNIPGAESGWFIHLLVYVGVFLFGLIAAFVFDFLFIKEFFDELWSQFIAGVLGVIFCVYGILLFAHSMINWKQVLSIGDSAFIPKTFACLFFGGAIYVALSLVSRLKERLQREKRLKERLQKEEWTD